MLRAMIADDEYKVCQLIEQLADWEKLGIQVIGICNDGEEALELISEKKPDIVITDIRMPVYDGLELIRRTREMGVETEFIVISGYRQFEYAYGAIQYGVSDYLLKPIDKKQLNGSLAKICEKYRSKTELEKSGEQLELLKTERTVWEEKEFLSRLLNGTISPSLLEEYRQRLSIVLDDTLIYQSMVLNTSSPGLHQPVSGFGEKVVEIAKEQFFMAPCFVALETLDGILLVTGYEQKQYPLITQAVSHIFSEVRALRDFYGDFDLVIAMGPKVEGAGRMGETTAGAVKSEHAKLIVGWNRIIDPFLKSDTGNCEEPGWARSDKWKTFDNALDCFLVEEAGLWFDGWLNFFQSRKNASAEDLLECRKMILKKLEFCCPEEEADRIRLETDRARNGRDFILRLKAAVSGIMNRYLEAREREETRPIRQAREYILKNYKKPLTLEEVAGHAGFSAVYFSTMFKKMTGQSFADYLTEVRLAEAKRLLKEENMSILEISEAVGYSDNKYFRKLFKKITGMKPSDYRKLYQ